jgi:hypothetical protein
LSLLRHAVLLLPHGARGSLGARQLVTVNVQ